MDLVRCFLLELRSQVPYILEDLGNELVLLNRCSSTFRVTVVHSQPVYDCFLRIVKFGFKWGQIREGICRSKPIGSLIELVL